jgi:hypothetical protein
MDISVLAFVIATANLAVLTAGAGLAVYRTARPNRHTPERGHDRRSYDRRGHDRRAQSAREA